MTLWDKRIWKALLAPGGVLLLMAAVLLHGGFLSISVSAVQFFYFGAFVAAILLGLRFQSSRVVMLLVTALLADRAIGFFSSNRMPGAGPGLAAFEVIALLLPVNFILAAITRERGFVFPPVFAGLALLFAESVLVTLVAQTAQPGPGMLHPSLFHPRLFAWNRIPDLALLAFAAAFVTLLVRFLRYRRPAESGMLWALAALFLAFQTGAVGRVPAFYFATAALILVTAIVETSYFMAFHDELTALPARRAFNQALLTLAHPYAVAAVDIDHFKNFNDTYGHETGDQVLRMVSGKLARVSGGGEAFRVGGEEFSILFRGKSAKQAAPHLELLRAEIEGSMFRVRAGLERRLTPRGSERRKSNAARRLHAVDSNRQTGSCDVSVTVSIGVAEPGPRLGESDQVIRAADQALYRAKEAGRNRVEIAGLSRGRTQRKRQETTRARAMR